MRVTALCITLAALAACERVDRRQPPPPPPQASQDVDTVAPAQPQVSVNAGSRATKVGTGLCLLTPRTGLERPAQENLLLSKIHGSPLDKENNRLLNGRAPDG